MKVKELDIVKKEDLKKLGVLSNNTVEEFVEWVEIKKKEGKRVNKFYTELYDYIKTDITTKADTLVLSITEETYIDEVYENIKALPIEEIRYYFDVKIFDRCIRKLRRYLRLKTLGDLYMSNFNESDTYEKVAIEWQTFLKDNYEQIINDKNEVIEQNVLPAEINRESGLIGNLERGLHEIGLLLSKHVDNERYDQTLKFTSFPGDTFPLRLVSTILNLVYGGNKTIEEIADLNDLTYERIRDVHAKTLGALFSCEILSENVSLNPDLIEWVNNVKNEFLFQKEEDFIRFIGQIDERRLGILGVTMVNIADTNIRFVIPSGTKRIYSKVGDAVISVLRDTVTPIDKEEILYKVEHHYKLADKSEYDPNFIEKILNCDELIDTCDSGLYLKTDFLSTDQQKMARLIYEFGRPITSKEALRTFHELYHHQCSGGLSPLKKYGLNNVSGNIWAFHAKTLEPIQSFINRFAEEKKIFYFEDLKKAMLAEGYIIPDSIRSYITNTCQVDNNDKSHFCHKDWIEDYPQYKWRNNSRTGITNWILNKIKEIFSEKDELPLNQLLNKIATAAADTDFESNIRIRSKYIIKKYSGKGQPFILKDKKLIKNIAVYDSIDFSTIGLSGGKYPFYVQIRTIILHILKKSEEGKISLVDAIKLINESIDEPQDRNTILRAITTKFLPDINLEIQTIDGKVYIVLKGSVTTIEPFYEIHEDSDKEKIAIAKESDITDIRPRISNHLTLDWTELENSLKQQLKFYDKWLAYEGINFEKAVSGFITFIKSSDNPNLNYRLPQSLYEYWHALTDHYDRELYLTQLILYFESLLSEIKYKKDKKTYHITMGLGSKLKDFRELYESLTIHSSVAKGFENIMKSLYNNRNIVAHGGSVDLESEVLAKTISDYVALYIYTSSKYY